MRAYAAHRIATLHEAKLNAAPASFPIQPKPSATPRPTPATSIRPRSAPTRRAATFALPFAD